MGVESRGRHSVSEKKFDIPWKTFPILPFPGKNFPPYFPCFTAFFTTNFRKIVSHLPQIFQFLYLFTTFSFFTIQGPSHRPGASYPSDSPLIGPVNRLHP